jgi:hypothetical protein
VRCAPCPPGRYKDSQSARPCAECPPNTYNPRAGSSAAADCAPCPAGAVTGGRAGRWDNASCACVEGFFLHRARGCIACPAGATCFAGRPPAFGALAEANLSLPALDRPGLCCDAALRDALLAALPGALGLPAGAVQLDLAAECGEAACAGQVPAARRRQLDGGLVLRLRLVVSGAGAWVPPPSLAVSLSALLGTAVEFDGGLINRSATLAADDPRYEYGPMTAAGDIPLVGCARGHLLVNDTVATQDCFRCPPTSYSLSPLDGCRGAAAGGCARRACGKCPRGAACGGGADFAPLVGGSVWREAYVPEADAVLMILASCPPGPPRPPSPRPHRGPLARPFLALLAAQLCNVDPPRRLREVYFS